MRRAGVLFVSHDASRTGGPISLLHFIRWFKKNSGRPFSILLGDDGEMRESFEELGDTWCIRQSRWRPDGLRTNLLLFARMGRLAPEAESRDVRRFAAGCSPALIYANCIASAGAIELLKPEKPVLTHVHELKYLFQVLAGPALSTLMATSRRFIACSAAVAEHLIGGHGLGRERVDVIYESIPVSEVRPRKTPDRIRADLKIPRDAYIIMGGGAHAWRKGADVFMQAAREVCRRRADAYFVWLGGSPTDVKQLKFDRQLMNLEDRVRVTGSVRSPADYLAAADVFALTSREDPYPLIVLEAAALSKPIVCFANAGGMPEFVEDDCGCVVPYLDLQSMVERLCSLLDSAACRRRMGQAAFKKVTERHDISVTAPRIMDVIERTISRV